MPILGGLVLAIQLVFPTSRESRSAEKAVRAIAKAFDPDKELRAAVADVEACGSVENRVRLARERMEHRMYDDAAALYRSCLNGVHDTDPDIRHGLAGALLEGGRFEEALPVAQKLRVSHPTFRSAEVGLVIARVLEGANRLEEALAELKVLADTCPGEEGRWRYGALLRRMGRADDAQRGRLDMARESMQA